jgi:hypothetical protein
LGDGVRDDLGRTIPLSGIYEGRAALVCDLRHIFAHLRFGSRPREDRWPMIRQPACGPRVNASAAATISATGSAGSSLDQPNIAAISAPQRSSNAPRKRRCSDPSIRLELRFPRAAAQTRIVSPARIWLDSWKSVRSFRGIFCADISGFESDHLSHAVRSPRVVIRAAPEVSSLVAWLRRNTTLGSVVAELALMMGRLN